MQEEEPHVKVLFRYYSNILEQETVETMWAVPVDKVAGLYQLDSIPFYGPDIAPNDIFHAEYDKAEEMLTFREVRQRSGSSVIQVVLLKSHLAQQGCEKNYRRLAVFRKASMRDILWWKFRLRLTTNPCIRF